MTVAVMKMAFEILQPKVITIWVKKFDNSKFREDLLLRWRNVDTGGSDKIFLLFYMPTNCKTPCTLQKEVRKRPSKAQRKLWKESDFWMNSWKNGCEEINIYPHNTETIAHHCLGNANGNITTVLKKK